MHECCDANIIVEKLAGSELNEVLQTLFGIFAAEPGRRWSVI